LNNSVNHLDRRNDEGIPKKMAHYEPKRYLSLMKSLEKME
jgi:hypothetical protein